MFSKGKVSQYEDTSVIIQQFSLDQHMLLRKAKADQLGNYNLKELVEH